MKNLLDALFLILKIAKHTQLANTYELKKEIIHAKKKVITNWLSDANNKIKELWF